MPAAPTRAATHLVGLPLERDSYAATALADIIDRSVHAATAQWTAGLSPAALMLAYMDWAVHLASAPGKRMQLAEKAARKALRLATYAMSCAWQSAREPSRCIDPLEQDRRFSNEAWLQWPFNLMHQGFLLQQQWWHNAMTGVRGVSPRHENLVQFLTRQALDVVSPSNFVVTNPEVLQRTLEQGGANLWHGALHAAQDWDRWMRGARAEGTQAFTPGREVALTPGCVVMRNSLIELIQYAPQRARVHPQPVLIVPAWIMKYYILDLSAHNSLIGQLVAQGFTVFVISWKNPQPQDRELGMEDYRRLGIMASLDAISAIVPRQRVHATGYCLGGTLLAIAAAAMARDQDRRLATLSLFAAQVDFTEAGELTLFISHSELSFLEDMMWEQGFLDSAQMAGAFRSLRSGDLVWSRMVREWLMGERTPMTDLMAWNADATRMPFRMHTEYLRQLFLDNDLAEGRLRTEDRPISLASLELPCFALGTETDHVAPWRSVFKINALTRSPVHFVLTSGGHNAGIVSEPGHPGRHFRVLPAHDGPAPLDAETWLQASRLETGSWWPHWWAWLASHSGRPAAAPPMGRASAGYPVLGPAPGSYVMQG